MDVVHADEKTWLVEQNLSLREQLAAGEGPACTRPWTSLDELWEDGSVRPCCWSKKKIGIVDSKESLLQVWNNEAMRSFRRDMKAGQLDDICFSHCPVLTGRKENFEKLELVDYSRTELAEFSVSFLRNRATVLQAALDGSEVVEARPVKLRVYPSQLCNLACPMCDLAHAKQAPSKDWYSNGDLSELLQTLEELRVWGGEPLHDRASRSILFDTPAPDHVHRTFVTNGLLLSPRMILRLRDVRVGWIAVSLDSCRPAVHEALRVGSTWSVVYQNLVALVELSTSHPISPFPVYANFVVQRKNKEEMTEFVRFCREHGITPYFTLVAGSPELLDCMDVVESELAAARLVAQGLDWHEVRNGLDKVLAYCEIYRRNGVHVTDPSLEELPPDPRNPDDDRARWGV